MGGYLVISLNVLKQVNAIAYFECLLLLQG